MQINKQTKAPCYQKRREYLREYVSDLAKDIAEGNADELDLLDLKGMMLKLHIDNAYSRYDKALETWDKLIIDLCESLRKCCDSCEAGEMDSRPAGELAACLAQMDNWLLRYLEIVNSDRSEESYYKMIEEWEQRLERLSDDKAWVMLSSLREILINRYRETCETEKLIAMLEKHTSDADTAAHFTGMIEGCRGKRYCTHNTMTLLKLLLGRGNKERAEEIINGIGADAEAVESSWSFYEPEGMSNNWLKYIILLEEHGYCEEGEKWRRKLSAKSGMGDGEVQCGLSYLKGRYAEALESCSGNNSMRRMLEYIISGKLPEDVDPNGIRVLEQKDPDSIHCRGVVICEDLRRELQLTNKEWHSFSASAETLTELFEKGLRADSDPAIYPPDYYKIPLTFEPEPAIMRGDYIKHMYKNDTRKNWLGLTSEDVHVIEKALAEAAN